MATGGLSSLNESYFSPWPQTDEHSDPEKGHAITYLLY